jgi:DNA modification methylase
MTVRILTGDALAVLRTLPAESVDQIVTSPPYYALRSYLPDDHPDKALEVGLEETPAEFVERLALVFREARRVIKSTGTLWLNLGDSYAGSWGAQSREHAGKHAPNVSALSANQVRAAARKASGTGRLPHGTDLKRKDLIGIPWEVAFALRADGWWLRSAIIWAKPNGMSGSQEDRCTSSYEMVFMLTKSDSYWSDFDAIKTPPRESTLVRAAQDVQAQAGSHRAHGGTRPTKGALGSLTGTARSRHTMGEAVPAKARRSDKQAAVGKRGYAGFNDRWDAREAEEGAKPAMMRDVWFISPGGFDEAHFAVMPEALAARCVLAGSPKGGVVLDPFGGAGTTGLVADRLGRDAILIELNPEYAAMADRRLRAALARVDGECKADPSDLPLFSSEAA